jgi:Holliday junction resolvase RusA-like endonuclease
MLVLTIPGKPMACPRPRATRRGRVYMPNNYMEHKKAISQDLRRAKILQDWIHDDETPLKLELHFLFKRPKNKKGKGTQPEAKTTKPDIDNLTKTIMDTLQDAGIIKDDKCIIEIHARKWYARKGEQSHTNLILEKIR